MSDALEGRPEAELSGVADDHVCCGHQQHVAIGGRGCCARGHAAYLMATGQRAHEPSEHEALYGSVRRITTVVCTCQRFAATYGNEEAARLGWAQHVETVRGWRA